MNSSDERAEELDALQATYGDCMVADSTYSGHVDISVKLQRPLKLTRIAQNQQEEVLYLPPVRICFELPNGYPDAAAPLVSVDASWLPTEVARQLETTSSSTWEEYGRMQVMYAYVSYLEEAAGEAFGMHYLEVSDDNFKHLLVYNKEAARQVFQQGTHECGICLDQKKRIVVLSDRRLRACLLHRVLAGILQQRYCDWQHPQRQVPCIQMRG